MQLHDVHGGTLSFASIYHWCNDVTGVTDSVVTPVTYRYTSDQNGTLFSRCKVTPGKYEHKVYLLIML